MWLLSCRFLEGLDVLLIFDKLLDWTVAEMARQRGIRIVLMPMHEITPESLPVEPDHYLCPSSIDLDRFRDRPSASMVMVPVDVPWRLRKRARLFVHNSGTRWSFFRNGTFELLAALPKIRSPIKLIIRMLAPFHSSNYKKHPRRADVAQALELLDRAAHDPRVELVIGTLPWEDLWLEGDVFVFPEKYNGLSLPLQGRPERHPRHQTGKDGEEVAPREAVFRPMIVSGSAETASLIRRSTSLNLNCFDGRIVPSGGPT